MTNQMAAAVYTGNSRWGSGNDGTGTEGPLLELRDVQKYPAVMCRYSNYRDS